MFALAELFFNIMMLTKKCKQVNVLAMGEVCTGDFWLGWTGTYYAMWKTCLITFIVYLWLSEYLATAHEVYMNLCFWHISLLKQKLIRILLLKTMQTNKYQVLIGQNVFFVNPVKPRDSVVNYKPIRKWHLTCVSFMNFMSYTTI